MSRAEVDLHFVGHVRHPLVPVAVGQRIEGGKPLVQIVAGVGDAVEELVDCPWVGVVPERRGALVSS